MTVETRSPTSNTGTWNDPNNAHIDDLNYAYCGNGEGGRTQDYEGYGFSSSGIINEVRVDVKGYSGDGTKHTVEVYVWDGSTWHLVGTITAETQCEAHQFDASAYIDTPAKLNAIKVQITSVGLSGGGPPSRWVRVCWIPVYADWTPGFLSGEDVKSASSNVKLPSEDTKSAGTHVKILGENIKSASSDVALLGESVKSASTNIKVWSQDSKSASVNVALRGEDIKSASSEVALLSEDVKVSSVQVALPSEVTVSVSTGIALPGEATISASTQVSIGLQGEAIKNAATYVKIPSEDTKTASTQVKILEEDARYASTYVKIPSENIRSVSTEIAFPGEVTKNASSDVALVSQSVKVVSTSISKLTTGESVKNASTSVSVGFEGSSEVKGSTNVKTFVQQQAEEIDGLTELVNVLSLKITEIRKDLDDRVDAHNPSSIGEYLEEQLNPPEEPETEEWVLPFIQSYGGLRVKNIYYDPVTKLLVWNIADK